METSQSVAFPFRMRGSREIREADVLKLARGCVGDARHSGREVFHECMGPNARAQRITKGAPRVVDHDLFDLMRRRWLSFDQIGSTR
jgi:hypothetical protein